MWKLKTRLYPFQTDPPMAKMDDRGFLVTSPQKLKELYVKTYRDRLHNREMKDEIKDVYNLKTELWNIKMTECTKKHSLDWTLNDLNVVLKKLKNNKSRDPSGLINEIFKPGVIGQDLKLGMLKLFNKIKSEQKLPSQLQLANITTIYKQKGSRRDMENDRGIFVVSILRMILESLIYNDKYACIDSNMTGSNIGARKERNIRDHLFIVYSIINSVVNGNEGPTDLQIYDVTKCFDSLWLNDVMLDLLNTLPEKDIDDKMSLLYLINTVNKVAIKTPHGLTERIDINNIVMQGGKWGPLMCANTIDKIGKKALQRNVHLYCYKGLVKIPPLGMIDDLLVITQCGNKSVSANIFINNEIEFKKLRLHTAVNGKSSKCQVLHVGKSCGECKALKVHDCEMNQAKFDTYLGM